METARISKSPETQCKKILVHVILIEFKKHGNNYQMTNKYYS